LNNIYNKIFSIISLNPIVQKLFYILLASLIYEAIAFITISLLGYPFHYGDINYLSIILFLSPTALITLSNNIKVFMGIIIYLLIVKWYWSLVLSEVIYLAIILYILWYLFKWMNCKMGWVWNGIYMCFLTAYWIISKTPVQNFEFAMMTMVLLVALVTFSFFLSETIIFIVSHFIKCLQGQSLFYKEIFAISVKNIRYLLVLLFFQIVSFSFCAIYSVKNDMRITKPLNSNIEWDEPLKKEIEHFVECITIGTKCITGANHAAKVVEILESC